eukprot:1395196-Amorphochlora_amoeboformis.AAC.1
MEYTTFTERPRRTIRIKSVLLSVSLAINVALLLFVGYNALPEASSKSLGLGCEASPGVCQAYPVADEDDDGKVTPEELKNMIEEVMHEERSHVPGRMMMIMHGMMPGAVDQCDMNGDGHISHKEAAQAMGMFPQILAGGMVPHGAEPSMPHDHAEYVEIQNRVRNEFKDAVLDMALKNHRNESCSKEECFGSCFSRCRWLLDPQTCVDTCNQGCETDAELFNPMEIMAQTARESQVKFGENDKEYTLEMKKPGLKVLDIFVHISHGMFLWNHASPSYTYATADFDSTFQEKDLTVEVRGPVLVIRGEAEEHHKRYNITHQFFNSYPLPPDVNKDEITSDLKNDVLKVSLPKDPLLTERLKEEREKLDAIAAPEA